MTRDRFIAMTMAGALALGAAHGALGAGTAQSGFLADYSRLEPDPDYPGSKLWVNPQAQIGSYEAIMIDPVVVHLSPGLIENGARPNAELLNEVLAYLHDSLVREFAKQMKILDKPGDGVVRYKAAITGITAEGGIGGSPVNYLPAVFVLRTATGQNTAKAHIYMEASYTDSVTGAPVGEVIQAATGDKVKDNAGITLGDLKEVLDKWAVKAAEGFAKARK
jgi:hypothetical protein